MPGTNWSDIDKKESRARLLNLKDAKLSARIESSAENCERYERRETMKVFTPMKR